MGDEDDEKTSQVTAAQDILQRIHQEAALRKKQKTSLEAQDSNAAGDVLEVETWGESKSKDKKKRKRKSVGVVGETSEEASVCKKRKKRVKDAAAEEEMMQKADLTLPSISVIESPLGASTPRDVTVKVKKRVKETTDSGKFDATDIAHSSVDETELVKNIAAEVSKEKKHKRRKKRESEGDDSSTSNLKPGSVNDLLAQDNESEIQDSGHTEMDVTKDGSTDEEDSTQEEETFDMDNMEQQSHAEVGGFTVIGQVKTKAKDKVGDEA